MDPLRTLLVPTDFSPLAEAAAIRAATLARPDRATIHLLHAVRFPLIASPYEVSVPAAVWEGVREAAEARLEQLRASIAERSEGTVTAQISDSSDPVQAIAEAAEEHGADLIVMGTHGHTGLSHAFLGSVAERTLRTLDRPVLAVKEEPDTAEAPIDRILLAVDFSTHAARALDVAAGLAERHEASVAVVHALDLPRDFIPFTSSLGVDLVEKLRINASEQLEEIRKQLEARDIPVHVHIRRGNPSVVICEAAEEIGCQLVVMGTRGASGLSHVLLGSVAERTLRLAPCSVLAVKSDADG